VHVQLYLAQSGYAKYQLIAKYKCMLFHFSYKQNAITVSRAFRDRPMSPLNTAIFWTEYVIRHGGASHMRSAALNLTWYQYLLLDVIVVLFVFGVGSLITICVTCRRLLHLLKSKASDLKAENKKVN